MAWYGAHPALFGALRVPAPDAFVLIPAGSAFVLIPAGSAFVLIPAGSAFVLIPAGSAFVLIPAGSAFVLIPAGSARAHMSQILTTLPFLKNGAKSGFEMCFGPSTLGAGAKTRLESRIKKFTPHCICSLCFSVTARHDPSLAMTRLLRNRMCQTDACWLARLRVLVLLIRRALRDCGLVKQCRDYNVEHMHEANEQQNVERLLARRAAGAVPATTKRCVVR